MTPLKSASVAPRQLQDEREGLETVDHHVDGANEVRAGAVHLVHEADPGDVVAVGLPPDGLGLRLDAGDRVEHGDGTVEDPERTLDLDREVHVAGRVDDVDPVALPRARGGGGRDGDAALALLDHPVHLRGALVDLADLVGLAGVVQDALGRGRLARVDVRHDPDVAGQGKRVLTDLQDLPGLPFDVLVGLCHFELLRHLLSRGSPSRRTPSHGKPAPGGRLDVPLRITIGSARMPCLPRPSCACPRGASRTFPCRSRRP